MENKSKTKQIQAKAKLNAATILMNTLAWPGLAWDGMAWPMRRILIAVTVFMIVYLQNSNVKMTKIKLMMNEFRINARLMRIFRSAGNFCHFHKNDGQQNNKQ